MKSKRFLLRDEFGAFLEHHDFILNKLEDDINEIKKKLSIDSVVKEVFTQETNDLFNLSYDGMVKKINGNKYLIFCPFHEEKTPSLMLNSLTQEYYCFSCGKKGRYDPRTIDLKSVQSITVED